MRLLRHIASVGMLTSLLAALPADAAAADDEASPVEIERANRPRVALVLSGGGARGFAHVGALRALKDLRVPFDMVVGVSMGSVVGGAYASGRTVEELEAFVRSTDWTTIVSDRPPRDDLSFRRREEDLILPSRIEFSATRQGISLPPAVAGNRALETALLRLLPDSAVAQPVDQLPLPFRSVASDLLTGELVELRSTPLFMSIRASLAVPGVFSPLRLDGRLVVDGGLVRNLPVDIARAMGAEVIIAINVGTPLAKESEITSAVDVAQQMLSILTEQNVQRSIKELGPDDVLIAPNLDGVTFLDFSQSRAAIAAGEAAVHASAAQLQRLSVSAAEYERYQLARTLAPNAQASAPPLDKVSVEATPPEISEALAAQTGLQHAGTMTLGQVSRAASRLFGGGDFDRVYVDVSEVDGRREAVLRASEAEWARSQLRLGVEMISDFDDDNRFNVSALHVMPWLNSWGAELRSLVRVGSDRSIGTQLQQPLTPGSPWHITPAVRYDASSADLYTDGRRIARVGYGYTTTVLGVGRELSNWGNVQLGVIQRAGRVKFLIAPDGATGDGHFTQRAYFAELQSDTVDSLAFPTRGLFFNAHWEWEMGSSGDSPDEASQRRSAVIAMQAFQLGDWAGHVYGEWAKSRRSVAPSQLGGFMRLSGTERGSVDGNTVVLGRVVMARRIGLMPPGMGGAVRAGLSLELGAGVDALQSVHFGDLRQAGSAFVAVDTRFGPLFFALGSTRNGSSAVYLFLGPYW